MKKKSLVFSILFSAPLLLVLSCGTMSGQKAIGGKAVLPIKKTLRVMDVDVHYEMFGQGKPIVMLHGYGMDRRTLKGCMEPIFQHRSGWKRIYFDLPGMGTTPRVDAVRNADGLLEFALEVVRQVTANEKIVIVGESFGGYLARGVVKKHPDLVDGLLILCSPGEIDALRRELPARQVLIKEDISALQLTAMEAFYFDVFAVVHTEKNWKRLNEEVVAARVIRDSTYLERIRQGDAHAFSFDVNEMDVRFEKPSLILAGRQDSIVGYKDMWNLLDNYPRATFAVLDMSGHALQIEQEQLFNVLVNEWLDRLEPKDGVE